MDRPDERKDRTDDRPEEGKPEPASAERPGDLLGLREESVGSGGPRTPDTPVGPVPPGRDTDAAVRGSEPRRKERDAGGADDTGTSGGGTGADLLKDR